VASSDDAIVTKDLGGTIKTWNTAAERIFGYKASEVVGGPISVIIPPERGSEERDILQRISRGETLEHFETVRIRSDGRRIEVAVTISPLKHEGRIIGASKIARDITHQKRLERELVEERARLEITLRSIGDAVIVTNADSMVTFMNPVAEELTGWKTDEARNQPLESVFHIINEGTRRRAENPASRALREGMVVGLANHTVLVGKHGAECAIDDSAAPIRDLSGELLGVVLVFRDVTGSRTADTFRARLAAIVESSDDAIISKDLEGRITSWNAGATQIFGYAANEAIGRPISILIPPDRMDEEQNILERIRRGERVEHFETVRIAKDRRRLQVSLTISPIRDAEGQVVGASKIARDITERKVTEKELAEVRAQLQKHTEDLEEIVVERTAELRNALAQLETFSYSISHDLRAPLRAINGFTELVLAEHAAHLNPEGRELLERVVRSGKRLSTLIEEVLNSAQSKLTPAHLRPIALSTLVPRVIQDYPNLREYRDVIDIKQPLQPVMGSEPLLTQCISNLLGNAVKFTAPARPLGISIWTDSTNGKVRLHVRDNGVGIAPREQPRIFEMFSRAENASGMEGNGVGLAIVKRAVVRMGGHVGVTSAPDVGSEFWIELPSPAPESNSAG
jgi:PAS domain S-box-containing protein